MIGSAVKRSIDRRAFVAACASWPFLRAAAHGAVFDTDVLVVGAGAAGLAAAHELRRLQCDFILLEAGARIGGRLYTETALGAPYDAGGRYIHWSERNPWTQIARETGVATQPDVSGGGRFFDGGVEQKRDPARRAAMSRLSDALDGDDVADVSIAAAAAALDPALRQSAEALARFSLGEEPQRVSARDYARLWSGDDLVVPTGYGALAQAYGASIPARKNVRVEALDWTGQGVTATTSAGVLRAKTVVLTVSVGVLQSGGLRFTPALPAIVSDALNGLAMGALSKVGLSFDFAQLDRFSGDIFAREGDGAINFDCRPLDRDIVVAVFGGDFARNIARTDEEAIAACLESFVRVVGSKARVAFRSGRAHAWFRDADALGCYSHCLPGHADAREKLATPIGGRIFIAGEATGEIGGAMTAGGAALAGQAAARAARKQFAP